MRIDDIADDGTNALPPQKSARPSLTLKEVECQHLTETVYFPTKPDWKPISLVLYDIKGQNNPVMDWIKRVYNVSASSATWGPSCGNRFKREAILTLYDGCGATIETWHFQNAWPQVAEFGDLEMSSSDVVVCEVTLRYDRAYVVVTGQGGGGGNSNSGGVPSAARSNSGSGAGGPQQTPGFGNSGSPGGPNAAAAAPLSGNRMPPGGSGGMGTANPSGGGLPGGFGVGIGSVSVGANPQSGFTGTGQISSGPFGGPLNTFINVGGAIMQYINGAVVPLNTFPGSAPSFRPGVPQTPPPGFGGRPVAPPGPRP